MSTTPSESNRPKHLPGSDSRDCIDLIVDKPGDTTVRPCPPQLLPLLLAEREKLLRWLPSLEQGNGSSEPQAGSEAAQKSTLPKHLPGSDSRDCIDLIIDKPGDTTVRPCPPHLLPLLLAEREKLLRWLPSREKGNGSNEPPVETESEPDAPK